jgi:hypothetical protein
LQITEYQDAWNKTFLTLECWAETTSKRFVARSECAERDKCGRALGSDSRRRVARLHASRLRCSSLKIMSGARLWLMLQRATLIRLSMHPETVHPCALRESSYSSGRC